MNRYSIELNASHVAIYSSLGCAMKKATQLATTHLVSKSVSKKLANLLTNETI